MKINYKINDLIEFENEIASIFNEGLIKAPVHLYSGNEQSIIDIFQQVQEIDWIFCSWRSHYQALLKGVPRELVKANILEGKSIAQCFIDYKFYSSAIVGGNIPIALGVAQGIKNRKSEEHVWCFVGDMTSETGCFAENYKYALNYDLPITFVFENNSKSVCTDTLKTWKTDKLTYGKNMDKIIYYEYENKYPHAGTGVRIQF